MIDWAAARAFTQEACADIFDYRMFTAIAMRKPSLDVNSSAAPDPERPSFEFKGTLDVATSVNPISSTDRPTASSIGDREMARNYLTAYARDWPWMLRQGDHVIEGGVRYVLASRPDRDGSDRVILTVNRTAG